ncbi:hypothetical protein C8T65DRAFT_628099 [Cerioporus squamosus]|nr:hypothetical protein C8T65DRAFT_628099 [Cerioporus squamosus]
MSRKILAVGFAVAAATLGILLISMFVSSSYSNCGQPASAQVASSYCDAASSICFQGYTDLAEDMTIGLVLPPLSPPSDEYIVQMVFPVSFGWAGLSMGGQMSNSLLFPLWTYDTNKIMVGPRWTDDYVLPTAYAGPKVTVLPSSTVNSTHVNAIFRCQNCTVWEGGSLGSGNLNGTAVLAYVASTTTGVEDPSDINSSFQEHDYFNFFGVDLSAAHSSSYSQYVGGGSGTTTAAPPPSTSSVPPSTTSSAPTGAQTPYGQCGGTGWTGPTTCASGLACVAVSPPYYSQCQPAK